MYCGPIYCRTTRQCANAPCPLSGESQTGRASSRESASSEDESLTTVRADEAGHERTQQIIGSCFEVGIASGFNNPIRPLSGLVRLWPGVSAIQLVDARQVPDADA